MSGFNGPDESARLEAALERIAQAAANAAANAAARPAAPPGLHEAAPHATTGAGASEVATRLDAVIAHIRTALGPQGI
jgi:hypothetical protein